MKRQSWLARYFRYFLMIGVLPVFVLGTIFYYANSLSLEREARSTHYAALSQALYKLDHLMDKMNEISYNLSSAQNGNIDLYNGEGADINRLSKTDESLIEQRLVSYEDLLGVPVRMVLFLRGDSHIYTSEGKLAYWDFEEKFRPQGNLTMSRFYTLLSTIKYRLSLRVASSIYDSPAAGGSMVHLYPIPYMDMLPRATLGFIFDDAQLEDLFENYLGDAPGSPFIYNEYLNEIYGHGEDSFPEEVRAGFASMKGTGASERRIAGKDYVLTRCVSESSGFSFVMATPKRQFYGRVFLMQNVVALSMLALLVIGILLAFVMSRRIYSPVKRLVDIVLSGEGHGPVANEFELLQGRYQDITDKNIEMSDVLDRQRPMVVYSCLDSLLRGKFTMDEEMEFSLKCAHVDLSSRYLFVLLVAPDGVLSTMARPEPSFGEQMQMLLSAVEGMACPVARLYALEQTTAQCLAVIVNSSLRQEGDQDIRLAVARALLEEIGRAYGLAAHIGGGRLYEEKGKINASFMEASVVLSDYMGAKRDRIMLFEAVMAESEQDYQYPVVEQALYIQSLKQADERAALRALDEMIQKISSNGSLLITQCLCYDIINMMIKLSGQLNGELKQSEIKTLCQFHDLQEFRRQAEEITRIICRQHEQWRAESSKQLKNDLIDYVNLHFCDPQLSLESMAAHFGLSPNYLSRFFKQESGYNFIQYVSFLRIERVKEKLVATDWQIKDIVLSVGYMDMASFVRKFKAHEGVTPGQFREKMREKGANFQTHPPA